MSRSTQSPIGADHAILKSLHGVAGVLLCASLCHCAPPKYPERLVHRVSGGIGAASAADTAAATPGGGVAAARRPLPSRACGTRATAWSTTLAALPTARDPTAVLLGPQFWAHKRWPGVVAALPAALTMPPGGHAREGADATGEQTPPSCAHHQQAPSSTATEWPTVRREWIGGEEGRGMGKRERGWRQHTLELRRLGRGGGERSATRGFANRSNCGRHGHSPDQRPKSRDGTRRCERRRRNGRRRPKGEHSRGTPAKAARKRAAPPSSTTYRGPTDHQPNARPTFPRPATLGRLPAANEDATSVNASVHEDLESVGRRLVRGVYKPDCSVIGLWDPVS